jgi:hypothetical protein
MLAVPLENRGRNQLDVAEEERRQVSHHPQSALQACAFQKAALEFRSRCTPPFPFPAKTSANDLLAKLRGGKWRTNIE